MTTAVEILSNGTAKAAWLILITKGVDSDAIDCGALAATIKAVLHSNLDKIVAEWKAATEARIGKAWLRELVNAQATEHGLMAADAYLRHEAA